MQKVSLVGGRALAWFLSFWVFAEATTAGAAITVWDASTLSGFFINTTSNNGLHGEDVDWGTLNSPQTITSFTIGYATDSSTDIGMMINFYEPHTTGVVDPHLASFSLTLPGVGITPGSFVAGTFTHDIPAGQRFTISSGFEYGYQPTSLGNGTGLGPLLVNQNLATGPGMEDSWDAYGPGGQHNGGAFIGTFNFGGSPYAQYYLTLFIPEPSTLGFLAVAVAGLLSRQRR